MGLGFCFKNLSFKIETILLDNETIKFKIQFSEEKARGDQKAGEKHG